MDRLVPVAEQALLAEGLRVERVINHPGFARLQVDDGQDQTELDLGSDARLFPVEERLGIPLLSGEELAVDKLLALFGRAEARDFADFLAVVERYGLDRLLDVAEEKGRGFDARAFAEMLTRIEQLPKAAFPLDEAQLVELQAAVASWRERALGHARRGERSRDVHRDRAPDLGLGR